MPTTEEISKWWDRKPCNIGHGEAEPGSSLWSHQVTTRKYWVEPHIPAFADFPHWKDKRVMELGCGIGTDTLQFAKFAEHVTAMDFSLNSIGLAVMRSEAKNVNFHIWDIEKPLPFTAKQWNSYHLVYSFGVLHHTLHPEAVLQNASRYLKPNGELRIMLYAKYSWKHLFTRQQPEAQAGCPYVKWYSMRSAKHLVESCGFRVTSIQKTHIFPWRIPDYTQYRYKRAFPWNIVPHEWLEPYLGHHLLIKAVKA